MLEYVLRSFFLKYLVYVCLVVTFVCIIAGDGQQTTKICNNPIPELQPSGGSAALRARHKTCFLRPDTGPCRADIIQWYFDVRQNKCYRFFWGGCQGNGNKFATQEDCYAYCFLNGTAIAHVPYFCQLAFDYGTCFGHYDRYAWDDLYKACKRHVYSGCGGNQNNFETLAECNLNCRSAPNNTVQQVNKQTNTFTTCMPLALPALNRRTGRRRR